MYRKVRNKYQKEEKVAIFRGNMIFINRFASEGNSGITTPYGTVNVLSDAAFGSITAMQKKGYEFVY